MTSRLSRTFPVLPVFALVLTWSAPVLAQRGPAASATHLPADVLTMACAPMTVDAVPPTPLRVTGGQDSFGRQVYAPGDLVTINAGTDNGIDVGQEYYVRRISRASLRAATRSADGGRMGTRHTAGWIRVYAVDDTMSLATITHACDAIEPGDYLEPFVLPVVPAASTEKPKPERDNYGLVMAGTDQRRTFAKGDFFIVNRGSRDGLTPGAQLVVYRDKREDGNFLYELGEAVAMEVGPDTSTVRVTLSRDAFIEGDYVALRRQPTRR